MSPRHGPMERDTLWDRAYAALQRALLAGRYRPGDRIVLRQVATFRTHREGDPMFRHPIPRVVAWLAAAAGALVTASAIAADAFPSKEIRLVVPWNVGGSNDIAARALSEIMARD